MAKSAFAVHSRRLLKSVLADDASEAACLALHAFAADRNGRIDPRELAVLMEVAEAGKPEGDNLLCMTESVLAEAGFKPRVFSEEEKKP